VEHRSIEYAVIQGIERGVWKWSVSVEGMLVAGQEQTRAEAIAAAQKAIDRAISLKKARLGPTQSGE
jgi:hypothetical protein